MVHALLLLSYAASLTGGQAYADLKTFEQAYDAKARSAGKRINPAEREEAVRQKAVTLLNGVQVSKVPGAEGLLWSHVYDAAEKYEDSLAALDRFLATKPTGAELFEAQLDRAIDFQHLAQIKDSDPILRRLQPTTSQQAFDYATAAGRQADYVGERSAKDGLDLLTAVRVRVAGYPLAENILRRSETNLAAIIKRESLIGKPAPELTVLPEKYGSYSSLAALKGKAVVLDFFADWSHPCFVATPALEELKAQLGDALNIVAVTTYFGYYGSHRGITRKEEFKDLNAFRTAFDMQDPVVFVESKQLDTYAVLAFPEFVLIGKDGKVKRIMVGYTPSQFRSFAIACEQESR